jgi:peptidyl-prolyl cis-trans isomerase C
MLRSSLVHCLAVGAVFCASVALAADLPPDVLVKSRWMELKRADFDFALKRIPEKLRVEFATNPRRVQTLLNNLLVLKTLAAQAKAHGTRPAAVPAAGAIADDAEREFAAGELKRIEVDAAQSFDAGKPAFEAKAREAYALERDKYRTQEEVRFSDIAVETKDRGDAVALARAKEARARIVAGADFAAVAHEYSDDPTTRDKGGALPFVTRDKLVKDYANGVFALTKVGEISQPIRAPTAWHVVRIEEIRPARQRTFDEARDSIMQTLRQRYISEQRDLRLQAINTDTTLEMNQPAIDALVTHVDPKLLTMPVPRKPPQSSAPK